MGAFVRATVAATVAVAVVEADEGRGGQFAGMPRRSGMPRSSGTPLSSCQSRADERTYEAKPTSDLLAPESFLRTKPWTPTEQ